MPGFFTRDSGRHARTPTRIEEVLCPTVLNDPMVDRDELNALLRDPSLLQVDEPPEADPPAEPPPESAVVRVAKLAGLVSAVALLCGAIVAAAFLDRQRQAAPPAAAESATITGVHALAGFAGPADGPGSSAVTADLTPAARNPANPGVGSPERVPPVNGEPQSAESVARTFYRLIGSSPDDALRMLDAQLPDSELRELARAWRDVEHVSVHQVRQRPDGMVLAVVTMTTEQADRYRVRHLLRIEPGPPPVITEARLLSAQRSPAITD